MTQKREKIINHPELGAIQICFNPRAVRYILKIKFGTVHATLPAGGKEQVLLDFIEQQKEQLLSQLTLRHKQVLNEETVLQTHTFSVNIFKSDRDNFYINLQDGILNISCPHHLKYEDENTQAYLKNIIHRALRSEANRTLPRLMLNLAKQHGFNINKITIKGNTSNWGSCSGKKNINLSYQILTLPEHLIHYILLHELCHTVEMNHSEHFWTLLDRVCGGKNAQYRAEMKMQRMLTF
jgi:hypothetical protein